MKKNILLLVIVSAFAVGCKKDADVKSGTVLLRDLPLNEAKKELLGNWKIHYRHGGITGNIKTTLNDSYFRVLSNDSIYLTFDNDLFAADKAHFERRKTTNFSWSSSMLHFNAFGGSAYTWLIDMKIGDTLVLVDDATNPDAYFMTKVQ